MRLTRRLSPRDKQYREARGNEGMSQSSINGASRARWMRPSRRPPGLIGKSRLTVVAGLGADVAGAQAAIALCERIGGVVDHMSSTALLRDLDVLRESGMMLTTPGEARTRGDVVLLVGDGLVESGLLEAMPDLRTRALTPPAAEGALRRIFRLGADEADMRALAGAAADSVSKIETISADEASLPGWLAALRARVNGRPVALSGARSGEIRRARSPRAAIGEIRRCRLVGGASRRPDDRNALRPRLGSQRKNALHGAAARAGRQCGRRPCKSAAG